MNFLEAYKSGKRFRRTGLAAWWDAITVHCLATINTEAVLAEDWEIEEETVTITRSQLMQAIEWTNAKIGAPGDEEFTDVLTKRLGFKL